MGWSREPHLLDEVELKTMHKYEEEGDQQREKK